MRNLEGIKMEGVIKILFFLGAILLWFFSRMRKSENKQKSNRQVSKSQDIIKQPEDILPQWNEEVREEESAEEETQPALSSLEKMIESSSFPETESAQNEKSEEKKEPEEKQPTVINIAGMQLSTENIRYGIIFSEILKRRGENLKK